MTAAMRPDAGLCGTCNNAASCFYQARRGPALYCELFDNFVEDPPDEPPAAAPRTPTPRNGYTGLCMNCENRTTCRSTRPEGVWHCENYQ